MKESSVSRREFIRRSALWTGVTGIGLAGPGQVFSATGPLAAIAGQEGDAKQTELIAKILAFVRAEQIDFFGIGEMSAAYRTMETVLKHEVPQRSRLPRVISMAFVAPEGKIARLSRLKGQTKQTSQAGKPDLREAGKPELRPRLSPATNRLCELLRSSGHRARALGSGMPGLPKMAGRLAGLGWIGRNSMLIIPGAGPRLALAAVLTDAPLPVTCKGPMEDHCGDCRRCVEACPAKAYTGAPFRETDPLEVRFDTEKCRRWCEKLQGPLGPQELCTDEGVCCGGVCSLCVKACPFGEGKSLLAE